METSNCIDKVMKWTFKHISMITERNNDELESDGIAQDRYRKVKEKVN